MTTVGIVGLGLIGGSLGKALKRARRTSFRVVGLTRSGRTAREARRKNAVDIASTNPRILAVADTVVLAVPVQSMGAMAKKIRPFLKKNAVLTDVGSVKGSVARDVRGALGSRRDVSFVGAHPVAGSEKTGLANADANLFKKSVCVLASDGASASAVRKVAHIWTSVGARVVSLPSRKHDRFLAATSHLPHILAFALFSEVNQLSKSDSRVKFLTAGSFRDMTRIAASSPDVWAGIFEANAPEIKTAWSDFDRLVRRLLNQKGAGLRSQIARLSAARKKWISR